MDNNQTTRISLDIILSIWGPKHTLNIKHIGLTVPQYVSASSLGEWRDYATDETITISDILAIILKEKVTILKMRNCSQASDTATSCTLFNSVLGTNQTSRLCPNMVQYLNKPDV